MTAGVKHPHADPSFSLGGESTYVIPAEAKVTDNPPAPGQRNRPGGEETAKATAVVVTSLMEAMDVLGRQRKAQKQGKALSMANPEGQEASDIGSGPWESYDSVSLGQVAEMLAACGKAIDAIQQREAVEAAAGNMGDIADTMDLGDAQGALDAALGIVARLAYSEGAASVAQKAGRVLSHKNEEHLRAARDHLSHVLAGLADNKEAGPAGDTEENAIMTTVTKEELASMVAEGSARAVRKALKAEKKAQKKAEKKARKNANNGGDISGAQEESEVRGSVDDQLNGVPDGGHVDPAYVNKEEKALKAMADQLGKVQEMVEKIARRPRAGGPVLDGQPRGAFPASESRLSDGLAKSTEPSEIEQLTKALEVEMSKPGPEAAARASDLSMRLTHARLLKAHEEGVI